MMTAAMLGMTKNQRFDHHGHGLGVGKLLADIDEIEIFEIDTVDRDNACSRDQFALDDITHEFGDIGIED